MGILARFFFLVLKLRSPNFWKVLYCSTRACYGRTSPFPLTTKRDFFSVFTIFGKRFIIWFNAQVHFRPDDFEVTYNNGYQQFSKGVVPTVVVRPGRPGHRVLAPLRRSFGESKPIFISDSELS